MLAYTTYILGMQIFQAISFWCTENTHFYSGNVYDWTQLTAFGYEMT